MTHALKDMTPQMWAALSDGTKLAIYELAAAQLATGTTRAQVRHENHWVTYHPGSLPFIQREIARLRALVGNRHGLSVAMKEPAIVPADYPRKSTGRFY